MHVDLIFVFVIVMLCSLSTPTQCLFDKLKACCSVAVDRLPCLLDNDCVLLALACDSGACYSSF